MGPKNPIKSPMMMAKISFNMNLEDFLLLPDELDGASLNYLTWLSSYF